MAAYTKSTLGPPSGGRFVIGDTVTDGSGVIWSCVKATSPRQWQAVNHIGGGGTVNPVTGVTVTEAGDAVMRKTTFSFGSNTSFGLNNTNQYDGTKLYTFPAGRIIIFGVQGSLIWTTTSLDTATLNTGSTLVWSAGTVTASSTTLGSTMADLLASSSVTTAAQNVPMTVSNAALTTSTHFDGTSAAKDIYLNRAVVLDASLDADATLRATGFITVLWADFGDV